MKWLSVLFKNLGPGLLYAGAAVGVSHLVQSTRAGAMYGFDLVACVLIVNLLKYPFFEIGTRYTIATGNVLLEGYRDLGRFAVWSFLAITVGTMFIIIAVVTMVTAGLVHNLTGISLEIWQWSGIILLFCTVLLVAGEYKLLDRIIRIVILLLTISVIVSLGMAIYGAPTQEGEAKSFMWTLDSDIVFLVALLGWMPIPIEAAVWQSDWTISAKGKDGKLPSLKWALIDFRVGYWGTTGLAIIFLSLGAIMMHGSGEDFSTNAVTFSDQLVQLISKNLGAWAYPFIATAACLTMFSTTLTCLDAYPRVVSRTLQVLYPEKKLPFTKSYWIMILLVVSGAIFILANFRENMRTMVDFATSVSFLTAPILAFMHFKIAQSTKVSGVHPLSRWMKILSYLGLIFLTLFAVYYLYLILNRSA
ncbi:NRAMP family divalent metal transporter [Leptospira sp. GIMC2001]|uniref:NRAMP family divalent metal transporter n=1 Tax=Leptospira sp. GIMC2001 TaxID=1513297 RepID=UPI00234BCA74|nr:divalent metal cation transporter [Leptospira sp. GIMC2001]WCL50248.1 divalent metal cation transporter [Leptospira sp. GIMC2001]